MNNVHIKLSVILCGWLLTTNVNLSMAQEKETPLEAFSPLIEGTWVLDNTQQTFEWGGGRQSVVSKSYVVESGTPRLSTEGMWFWHPGEKKIKGYFRAVNMPVSFFDYTTTFEKNKIVHKLSAFTSSGMKQEFWEIMEFAGDGAYCKKTKMNIPKL